MFAQAAIESWWQQGTLGDWTTDASRCAPGRGLGVDGQAGQCPESFGILQNRYPYEQTAWPGIATSTAMNADLGYAIWRVCFEGYEAWLNTVERGQRLRRRRRVGLCRPLVQRPLAHRGRRRLRAAACATTWTSASGRRRTSSRAESQPADHDRVDAPGQLEVLGRHPAGRVGRAGERQRAPPDVDVGVVVQLLGDGRHAVDHGDRGRGTSGSFAVRVMPDASPDQPSSVGEAGRRRRPRKAASVIDR